jgi:hypothetical protein
MLALTVLQIGNKGYLSLGVSSLHVGLTAPKPLKRFNRIRNHSKGLTKHKTPARRSRAQVGMPGVRISGSEPLSDFNFKMQNICKICGSAAGKLKMIK